MFNNLKKKYLAYTINKCDEVIQKVSYSISKEKYNYLHSVARDFIKEKYPNLTEEEVDEATTFYKERLSGKIITKADTLVIRKADLIDTIVSVANADLKAELYEPFISYGHLFETAMFENLTKEEECWKKKMLKAMSKVKMPKEQKGE